MFRGSLMDDGYGSYLREYDRAERAEKRLELALAGLKALRDVNLSSATIDRLLADIEAIPE